MAPRNHSGNQSGNRHGNPSGSPDGNSRGNPSGNHRRLKDRADLFQRQDNTDDRAFYSFPRLVIHVDEHASGLLAGYLAEHLPSGGDVLDLMSAWRSHIAEDHGLASLTGLGMNETELAGNPALTSGLIHDLNKAPLLPFTGQAFDACLILFSLQYLLKPVDVMADIARVLRPGGMLHVAYTNRMFPTKAVAVWRHCGDVERARLIAAYMDETGAYGEPRAERLADGSDGDPLYVVSAGKD